MVELSNHTKIYWKNSEAQIFEISKYYFLLVMMFFIVIIKVSGVWVAFCNVKRVRYDWSRPDGGASIISHLKL